MDGSEEHRHDSLFKGIMLGSFLGIIISLLTGSVGVIPLGIVAGIIVGALHDRFIRRGGRNQ